MDFLLQLPQTLGTGPELFIIPAILAGAGAGIQAIQAQKQASAAKRAQESVRKGADIQTEQLKNEAAQRKLLREREAAQARGRLSVNSAAAGIGEGDYANLYGQVNSDLRQNLETLDTNLNNQIQLVQTGAQADVARLDAQIQNPLLAGIMGGLQGAQTGLSIASLGNSLANASPPAGGAYTSSSGTTYQPDFMGPRPR